MSAAIQAADANRHFSRILREVRAGQSYTITSHGRPVARLVPATESASSEARARLLDRLRAQPDTEIGRWSRDALYER